MFACQRQNKKISYIANQSNACQLATIGRVRRVSVHKLFPMQCIKSPVFDHFCSSMRFYRTRN
ncbi:hypothetical protein Gotur_010933 [Gossypium turneri]